MPAQFPTQTQLTIPLLDCLAEAGGRASAAEACERLAEKIHLPAEVRLDSGPVNAWDRHIRWVRQRAVLRGFVASPAFKMWEVTEAGNAFLRNARPGVIVTVFETELGCCLWSEAEAAAAVIEDGSVQMCVTSPPYCLLRKKAYAGQFSSNEQVAWLTRFFGIVKSKLKDEGSLFLNVSDVWEPGQPTTDPWNERLVIALMDECGYHLAQNLYWHNPARLPGPASWVTVRRIRVVPDVERLFFLAKNPNPYADNRNVLRPYSASMRARLAGGEHLQARRPSGHVLSAGAFSRDNGGAIPGALITAANTSSNDTYQRYCREHGLPAHPARFPEAVADFAIRLASRPGDIVWDPFGGSLTTAAVAERLGRRWISGDKSLTYLMGGRSRFPGARWALPEAATG
ncbi:MAG: site-specific DNA-methyltransferase [Opitutaceae bacterium]|nr:site-specific DNA-methyltransferase [Opitutaceae bacterium]